MRHLIDIQELSTEEIAELIGVAEDIIANPAKYAEACGYDAISSLAPFYYKFSFEQVKKYYFDYKK